MTTWRPGLLACLLLAVWPAAAQRDAGPLLAKSVAAFENNQKNEKHWNWTIVETRQLLNRGGEVLENFPAVTSESVIRSDGRRCNAVTAWGDGRVPYKKDAEPDERCQAFDALGTPFDVALLLNSTNAKVIDESPSAIRISVLPDKSHVKGPNYAIRCAASIKATLQLDPATYFPIRIEGEVVESGCNGQFQPIVHYERWTGNPMVSQFRKGATFRVDYALQKDKFDDTAKSFWISSAQHYSQPWGADIQVLYYWGRQIMVKHPLGHRLIKEIKTTAQEFGAASQLHFDR